MFAVSFLYIYFQHLTTSRLGSCDVTFHSSLNV